MLQQSLGKSITAAAAGSVAVNAAIAAIALGPLDASGEFEALAPGAYITLTVLGVVAGALGWRAIARRAKDPARTLGWLVPAVVALSLIPDAAVYFADSRPGVSGTAVLALVATPSERTAAADRLIDPRHPYSAHRRHAVGVEHATTHAAWTPDHGPMPALFLGHGATLLFEYADWMRQLHDWAHRCPSPRQSSSSRPTGSQTASASPAPAPASSSCTTSEAATPSITGCGTTRRKTYCSPARSAPRCRAPSRCTNTATAGSTTALGCRSRPCTRPRTSRSYSSACRPPTAPGCSRSAKGSVH